MRARRHKAISKDKSWAAVMRYSGGKLKAGRSSVLVCLVVVVGWGVIVFLSIRIIIA